MTDKKLCAANTKKGNPCKVVALPDNDFCFSHKPKLVVKEEPQEVVIEPTKVVCGHINRHSLGPNGKPDNLSCTMKPGHSGPHSAMHYEKNYFPAEHKKGGEIMEPKLDYEGEIIRHWADQAGTPADKIEPDTRKLDSMAKLGKLGLTVEDITSLTTAP
jgi:hypothetical protein